MLINFRIQSKQVCSLDFEKVDELQYKERQSSTLMFNSNVIVFRSSHHIIVPWDPKDAVDPRLSAIRDARGYSYADIITVHPDHLPGYEDKVKSFFEEHIHDAEEIRYVISGSGFFDVRDGEDKWVRVHVKKGDLMTLPEGIYHRFTTDEDDMIHAMRLFVGQPVWTPFNRPCEEHPSRKKFVELYMVKNEEKKADE